MYKVKYLQEELTSLFRTRILEDGNPAEDAMDYLGNIDFHALTQAVQDKARTAYTYITQGMQEKSFNYRGPELFGQKATLLYVEDDQSTMEIAVTTRTLVWIWRICQIPWTSCAAPASSVSNRSTSCKKRRRSARRTCPRWALLLPPKRIFTRSV